MLAHDLQINTQYERFLKSDINYIRDSHPETGDVPSPKTKMPMAVFWDEQRNLTKMSALCPHMKGVVCWTQTEKSFDCHVHRSRFSPMGLCVNRPSKGNLEPAEGQISGSFKATVAAAKGTLL